MTSFQLSANVVDVLSDRIYPATVAVDDGRIHSIEESSTPQSTYLIPGFVDAHIHIESSMLTPVEFARAAVIHGTVATVSDVHEIANVLGMAGIKFMLEEGAKVPLKFHFGAPSCVPATQFETSGATISTEQVAMLLDDPRIGYLSEVMNYPGVLAHDEEVMAKIDAAISRRKPIDGHAPGLRGQDAQRYFATGISTDHECFTKAEALDKLDCGVHILIREGSAARNFNELYGLIDEFPERCMLCSDDKHPDELLVGHIDQLARRAISGGQDVMNVLRCACVNPVLHYGLDVGLLRRGDPADFVQVDDLEKLNVLRTYVDGELVAEAGKALVQSVDPIVVNQFDRSSIDRTCLKVPSQSKRLHVIRALDGQLITRREIVESSVEGGFVVSDPSRDLLKLAVFSRYDDRPPAIAFVRGFGLKQGAIASSVAHDSHNVIAVGVNDVDLCAAVNAVIELQGGLAAACGGDVHCLPLPVAGLMSTEACGRVAEQYTQLDRLAKDWGSKLGAPYTTLSFMALLVIPSCKLSDHGLFDVDTFEYLPLFADDSETAAEV